MTREPIKFLIINSFRLMVYIAYFAIIIAGVCYGLSTGGSVSQSIMFVPEGMNALADIIICGVGGFLTASLICGLIVTILDIRDDLNDRLPEARD